ncbi:MAG: hypothetical protein IJG60_03140 [Thermoguttaceae bacterium]|nr:hypothetical protein [Thermoguttaceae bacterium]
MTPLHIRSAEQLEERLPLSGFPFPAAGEAFAPAAGLLEPETAFLAVPIAEEEIASAFPSQTADAGSRFYVGFCYDANKTWSGDTNLCWAAASSNALAYTNWGFAVKSAGATPTIQRFIFVDDIFNYFKNSFSDEGSRARYAFPWFMSGSYEVSGWTDWAQPANGSGGFFPGISVSDKIVQLESSDCAGRLVSDMAGYLEKGWGVTLGVGWFQTYAPSQRTGGHAVSVWGYTYDETLDPASPGYYTGLIITDSDDGKIGTLTVSLEWNSAYQMYRLSDYYGGTGWLEDFTCLKPTKPLTGIKVAGYYGPYDGRPHSITISGLDGADAGQYTVSYWQNGIQLIQAPAYTTVGTRTVTVTISRNRGEAVWSAPVTITITEPETVELNTPRITELASAGKNSHSVAWTEVAGAAGYELAWSADGGQTWNTVPAETARSVVKNLACGTTVLYRVRALGDGVSTSTGPWSAEKSLLVNPSDLDGDGFIGPGDFSLLSSVWFTAGSAEEFDPRADIDGDGFIGPGDFTFLSANWFKNANDPDLFFP